MRHISRIVGVLLTASLFLVGLTPGFTAAAADDANVQTVGHNLSIDVTGLPNGTLYFLTVSGGAAYDDPVEVVEGPDLVLPHTAGTVNLSFEEMVYTDMGVYERSVPGSSPFPITVSSDMTYTATYASGSITGTVFDDYNGNNVRDAGEPGIPNAKVELLGTLKGTPKEQRKVGEIEAEKITDGLTVFFTGMTDGDGNYAFDNIPVGTFYVRATLPGGGVQESNAITLVAGGGVVSSGEADFPQAAQLPYTGK